MNTDGAWFFKVVPWFIAAVFLIVIGFWVFAGIALSKAAEAIPDGCVPALVTEDKNGRVEHSIGCKKK